MEIPAPSASIWRNRDVRLLVTGSTVNSIGDWLIELALPLYIFSETGSGLATGGVYVLGLVTTAVFGPFGGRLADTLNLKRTLVITNLLQIVALLPLLGVTSDRLWPLFLVVVAQGLIRAVNDPAAFAVLPRLVNEDQLIAANSAFSAGNSLSRLVGAAAGGFAVEFGGMVTVVLADGLTFLVGAITAALLSSRADSRSQVVAEEGDDSSVRTGFRLARAVPGMKGVFAIQGLSAFVFGGFPVLFIIFITDIVGGSESDVGIVRACAAFGGVLGAAAVGAVSGRIAPPRLLASGFVLFGLVALLFVNAPPFTTALWVYMLLYGSTGFPNAASGVGMSATVQQICPPQIMGRVGGVSAAIYTGAMAAGAFLAGVAVEFASSRALLNVQAGMLFSCGVIGFSFVANRAASSPVR